MPIVPAESAKGQRSPVLLVSVRSVIEAEAAIQGGCDLLDLKEPSRGALGPVDFETMEQVVERFGASGHTALNCRPEKPAAGILSPVQPVPVSVALGELRDFCRAVESADGDATRLVLVSPQGNGGAVPAGVTFGKVGCAGLRQVANWPSLWRDLERLLVPGGVISNSFQWVAVAYADAVPAEAPPMRDVLLSAIDGGCRGFLVDTWSKGDRCLFDWTSLRELQELFSIARAAGLFTAVAGRLSMDDLPRIAPLDIDIIGVRSAVCFGGDRQAGIDSAAVARLRDRITSTFTGHKLGEFPIPETSIR